VPERVRFAHEDLEFARAVTFFDAIFAFAVTLLITTVDDFSPEAWSSLTALNDANGPSLRAFTISFVVVVSFWRAHHQGVTSLSAMDGQLLGLNCVVMFGIVLIPFTTEALGKLDLPLPVAVYAVDIALTYLALNAVELIADRRGMRPTRMTRSELRSHMAISVVLPLIFLGSIPIAYLVSPTAAELTWLLIALLIPFVRRLTRARARAGAATTGSPEPITRDGSE